MKSGPQVPSGEMAESASDVRSTAARLSEPLLAQARACLQAPRGRFRHPWISATPPGANSGDAADDRFTTGDYSAGIFHHDASEAAIELLQHSTLR